MSEGEVVIVDGCRTAFGKKGGGLRGFAASELGGICVKALLERSGITGGAGGISNPPKRRILRSLSLPFYHSSPIKSSGSKSFPFAVYLCLHSSLQNQESSSFTKYA